MSLPAVLTNALALTVACAGAGLLFVTRLRERRALDHLATQSEGRAIDQPMLFLDVRTERRLRQVYRLGYVCLGAALLASWLSTHL
ncbi:hypothetical protein ACW9H6_22595 [Pseudomonas sp. SDO528_S397]